MAGVPGVFTLVRRRHQTVDSHVRQPRVSLNAGFIRLFIHNITVDVDYYFAAERRAKY